MRPHLRRLETCLEYDSTNRPHLRRWKLAPFAGEIAKGTRFVDVRFFRRAGCPAQRQAGCPPLRDSVRTRSYSSWRRWARSRALRIASIAAVVVGAAGVG
jgi:hypothetical protein